MNELTSQILNDQRTVSHCFVFEEIVEAWRRDVEEMFHYQYIFTER